MKIICAGFPKTGTKSMALALSQLGYTVHDFEEHNEYNLDNYLDFFEGRVGEEIFLEMYRYSCQRTFAKLHSAWTRLTRAFSFANKVF